MKLKKKYDFDVNVMVMLNMLVAVEAALSLFFAIFSESAWLYRAALIAVALITLTLAELALDKKYQRIIKSVTIYITTFVFIPLWIVLHGNIALAGIIYFVILLLALNTIATRVQRYIINPFVTVLSIGVLMYEYHLTKHLLMIRVEGEYAVVYIIITPLVLFCVMGLIVFMIDRYRVDHELLKQKNIELEHLMRIDTLTGLFNKQYLNEQISVMMSISRRNEFPLSVLVIDIDYFKNYNDRYGHIQGDKCLVRVAGIINNSVLRDSDCVFRFGGEEFVVLLHNVDENDATSVAQRIVDNVKEAAITNTGSQINTVVTISVGLFTYDGKKEMTTNSVIRMADEALYMAKNSGRDRVCTLNVF